MIATDSNKPKLTWKCPRCGCKAVLRPDYRSWDVRNTYPLTSGNTRRVRLCRACHQGILRTEEVPVPEGFKVIVVPEDEQ